MRTSIPLVALLAGLLLGASPEAVCGQSQEEFVFELVLPGHITAFAQDRAGYVWVGTADGLFRYDGYQTVSYRHEVGDSSSLSDDFILPIHADPDGSVWIATLGGGLNRFDPRTQSFTRYRATGGDPRSISSDTVWALEVDSEGVLWAGTARGLDRFDRETDSFVNYGHDPDDSTTVSHHNVRYIYEDRRGTLWVGTGISSPGGGWDGPTDGGLNRFDRASGTFTRYLPDPDDATALIDGRVHEIYEDSRGNFWVGTWGDGLHKMDRATGTFTRYSYDPDRPDQLSPPPLLEGSDEDYGVTALHEDQSGNLWIGATGGGLHRYDPRTGQLRHLRHDPGDPQGLVSNVVYGVHSSRDGTLWVRTAGGLHRLESGPVRLPRVELPGDNGLVYSLIEDRTGAVWLGTERGGLYRYDRGADRFDRYRHDPNDPTSLGSGTPDVIHEDQGGVVWVGTHGGGLNRFHPRTGTFTRYVHDPSDSGTLSGNVVHEIYEDRSGDLWVGTWKSGLNRFDPETGQATRYRHDPVDPGTLSSDDIRDVVQDARGRLWIATARGMNLFDPDTERFVRIQREPGDPGSLISDDVTSIRDDADGRLWLATGGGLARFEPSSNTFRHFGPGNSGLPTQDIFGVLPTKEHIWAIAQFYPGVLRLDPAIGTAEVYEEASRSWNGFRAPHSVFKSRRDELLIGRSNGFYAFFPDEIVESANQIPPQIVLGLRAGDEVNQAVHEEIGRASSAGIESVMLSRGIGSFSFQFAALHFTEPDENRYVYRLTGFDDGWRGYGTRRTATYSEVPPGEYVFEVKAANRDGVWTEEATSMAVVVRPAWWQTWWAQGLFGTLFLGVLALGARTYRRRVQRTERERARAREIEHAREIGAMNEQLRTHEAQLEAQNERLRELDAQKSRFFANLSHEFRTPLTLLLGPLQDLMDRAVGPERLVEQVPLMHRNGRRLLRLINQLLDLSKLEAQGMQLNARAVNLVAFLQEVVLGFSGRAGREGLTLSFSSELESIETTVDSDKLEKVISNLLSNAFKFTPPGGKVRVAVDSIQEDDAGSEQVVISVKDTGRGIPKDALEHIFDRFYQADGSIVREHEGTGIGLALARELVELHGGSICVESEVGFGTRFAVRLPVEAPDTEPGPVPEVDSPDELAPPASDREGLDDRDAAGEYELRDERGTTAESAATVSYEAPLVLLVEDNPDMRAYLRGHLEGRYRVSEAEHGEAGLATARTERPDLVLADVMMPKMDGYDLCRAIKSDADLSDVPVVLLTAKADLESKVEGLEAGADDYLAKPFSAEELLVRMENLIEIRSRLRERYTDAVRLGPEVVEVPSREAAFLEEVRRVVEERMGRANFGVDELAAEVGLSARQLQRRLKEAADLAAGAYIRMMRLERAAQLLEQEAGLVSEVAYRVGFKSADHFSRLFKQVFGLPPSEYAGRPGTERTE